MDKDKIREKAKQKAKKAREKTKKDKEEDEKKTEVKNNIEEKPASKNDKEAYLLSEIRKMKKRLDKKEEDIELLKEVADKKKLARYYSNKPKNIPTKVKLRTIKGKVITKWFMIDNIVEQDESGRWYEKQKVKVVFEGGSDKGMTYKQFVRRYKKVDCKVISTTRDEQSGEQVLKVERLDNGEVYEVETKYIN